MYKRLGLNNTYMFLLNTMYIQALMFQFNDLKVARKKLADDNSKLTENLQDQEAVMNDLKNDLRGHKIKIAQVENDLSLSRKRLKSREDEINDELKSRGLNTEARIRDLESDLDEKTEALESISIKHANLLVSKKTLEDELEAAKVKFKVKSVTTSSQPPPFVASEVASELASVKIELKRLHSILTEKERELTESKLNDGTEEWTQKAHQLRTEVVEKEAKIHEVNLNLELERRKLMAYEDHITHLKDRIDILEERVLSSAKVMNV